MDEVSHDDYEQLVTRMGERFGRLAVHQFERYFTLSDAEQRAVERMSQWCRRVEEETGSYTGVMIEDDGRISVRVDLSKSSPWLVSD